LSETDLKVTKFRDRCPVQTGLLGQLARRPVMQLGDLDTWHAI